MTPEKKKVLENYKKVRAKLDENVEKLRETYHSFPFQDVKAYQKLIKKAQESENSLIQVELNQQTEHINDLYNSLDIGKIFLWFLILIFFFDFVLITVKSIKTKKSVMEVNQIELTQIDDKLEEMKFKETQLVTDFSKNITKEILNFATVLPVMQEIQIQIQEVKEETALTKDSITKIDQEMEMLNVERLNLEREYYVEKSKQNAKPIKIEKINLGILTKKVVFNKKIQEISPSSSESSNSIKEFVPYIERRPAKPSIDLIKTEVKVKPIKHVPRLIPITELQSKLKVKLTEKPKETMKKQPVPEVPTKLEICSAIKRLPDPDKSREIVPKTTPKKFENIKILEDIIIKPADKKNFVVLPSTSTTFADNSSTNKFTQPSTNIRIVSKRKECSPISLKDLQKISPNPIEKIKHLKLMPSIHGQIKEKIKSPDTKTIVLSSEEMSPASSMENLLKDVDTNSIQSFDLENFDDIETNLNEMENWDLESNFSADPQISDVDTKTSIADVDEVDKNHKTTDFFGQSTKKEKFDFFSF